MSPPPNGRSASFLFQASGHNVTSITENTHLERRPLTQKNLEKLNDPEPAPSTASSERTYQSEAGNTPKLRSYNTNELPRHLHLPTLPQESTILQNALGSKCTREIESLNYHTIKALHLIARARELNRSVYYRCDYDDLADLRDVNDRVTGKFLELLKLGRQEANPKEVLKEILSPDFWESERKYLESPGCLELRQKVHASLTGILPKTSSVENHEPPYQESSAKGCLTFPQEGKEEGEEIIADNDSLAPFQTPLRRARSRTHQPMLLASPARTGSRDRSVGRKQFPVGHQRLGGKNKSPRPTPRHFRPPETGEGPYGPWKEETDRG
ncbi:MAG: hypothetical protein M1840_008254 [Geoglossum simile]|nr:MAG: hypothetical protein M1840_008254 [Geoglossum simile]